MIKEAIRTAVEEKDLPFDTARQAMLEIMRGQATHAQIAAFLTALRMKGETIDEITACAAVMRERCTELVFGADLLEIVGTGGDGANTFNISTVCAFVAAAAGVPVAKHGNRGVSSKCGAADFLEALGAKLELTPRQSEKVLGKTGMCFMFAPVYHSSMKYAAAARKEIGVRTLFNILGPLANPAGASVQLLGVYDKRLVLPLARVLSNLGVKRAMVVCGDDGMDEISLCAPTTVCELRGDHIESFMMDPREYGFSLCAGGHLAGGGPFENREIALRILKGEKGPKRDVVLLNAAACLYLTGRADDIAEGLKIAAEAIDSGMAYKKTQAFVSATNEACV